MRVFLLGASRNVGYSVTRRLLANRHTCTLLLRRTEAIESDAALSLYIADGRLKLARGDGVNEADVQQAWNMAKEDGEVDAVYFGIGGEPEFKFTKGFIVSPGDLTERCMTVLLSVIQSSTTPSTRPKLVTITSNGLDRRTKSLLPLPLKLMYSWLLHVPHLDKIQQENAVKRAAGWEGGEGWLGAQNVVIVRPSMFTSGECAADKKDDAYRIGEGLKSAWTVSRADVGHFVAEKVPEDWGTWAGKAWVISY
ncbi:NAD(P)H-binding family protein [Ceratobasidium sp. AG-Ba]|nr:NAD(P)H-binding family protein [Ceratobasidium sp. AG-Ba]